MKVLRISTALSLLLLTAVIPAVQAAGDPNIDSGVGTASSRGPYGFNFTGGMPLIPMDNPPNDYGVWRDAYGGFRDSGMIPDNLTTRVHEPTWEETHPHGPIVPSGSPGGLAGAGGIGGIGGIGGFGIGFPLGGAQGAFGAFTNTSPLAAAANAMFTKPVPAGMGTGLGPVGGAIRTSFGFAGAPNGFLTNMPPFTGAQYLGQASGYLVNPRVTASNVTAGSTSTNTWSWNTSFGPARLVETTTGTGANATTQTTFTYNGNTYTTNTVGAATNPGFNFLPTPPTNGTSTETLSASNNFANPALPAGAWVDQFNFAHRGGETSIGGGYPTPATAGSQNSFAWPNSQATGNFGGYPTNQTSGSPNSVFYGGSFGSNTIGGFYASQQTAGSPSSISVPNADIGNGAGVGGGSLASVGFGSPGYGVPNLAGGFPGYGAGIGGFGGGYGGSPYAGYSGAIGAGAPMGNGYPMGGGSSAGTGTSGTISAGTGGGGYGTGTGTGIGMSVGAGAGGRSGGTNIALYPGAGGGGWSGTGIGAAGITGSALGPVTTSGNETDEILGTPVQAAGPAPGPMMLPAPSYNPEGTTTSEEPGSKRRIRGKRGSYTSERIAPRAGAVARLDNGDGAYGFFGGTRAIIDGLHNGLSYGDMPYLGGRPQSPLAWYTAARVMRDQISMNGTAAAGEGPIGNITTDLEGKLAAMHLTPCEAIGRVIGSMRFANGDIMTYGTRGTLRLASDNSGSITFNSGEILTFRRASAELRRLALTSTQIF